MSEQLNLEALFRRALNASSKVVSMSTMDDETQSVISAALADYQALVSRINTLGLFSPNETFEEISILNAVYMLVPYCMGDIQLRVRTLENEDRMDVITKAMVALKSFVRLLDDYEVIPAESKGLHAAPLPVDRSKLREVKIAQYKAEKAVRSGVQSLIAQRNPSASTRESPTDFGMIWDLLSSTRAHNGQDEDEVQDILKAVLKLFWIQALGHIANIEKEVEILRSAPPSDRASGPPNSSSSGDEAWKLDMPMSGNLLDKNGRPLRPFTILPSTAGDRARFQAGVFGPDHRLPTMTIDEYLEEERRRGNIITGGGEASFNAPTSKELLQEASEMDGTLGGEEKSDQKRKEEEDWAMYTEANPKGMGNTMNRG